MKKFYNNPAWDRIRGLRGFGILALSVAFCLAGVLAFSSCDILDDDDEAAPEPMEMRGFFISVDYDSEDNQTVCSIEDADVYLEGDESTGKLAVSFTTAGTQFQGASFNNQGFKLIDDNGDKTIATAYISEETDGTFVYPGSYYLASKTDADIAGGETIFTGYWVGHAYRPGEHPVVLCPYVLVPRDALDKESCGGTTTTDPTTGEEMTTNGTDPEMVDDGLAKYLTQNGGTELRACYNVFDENEHVSPEQRMP